MREASKTESSHCGKHEGPSPAVSNGHPPPTVDPTTLRWWIGYVLFALISLALFALPLAIRDNPVMQRVFCDAIFMAIILVVQPLTRIKPRWLGYVTSPVAGLILVMAWLAFSEAMIGGAAQSRDEIYSNAGYALFGYSFLAMIWLVLTHAVAHQTTKRVVRVDLPASY